MLYGLLQVVTPISSFFVSYNDLHDRHCYLLLAIRDRLFSEHAYPIDINSKSILVPHQS